MADVIKCHKTGQAVCVASSGKPRPVVVKRTAVRVARVGRQVYQVVSGTHSITVSFSAADWVAMGGGYYLDIAHGLESDAAVLLRVDSDTGDQVVAFQKVENYTANKIRVSIPAAPEMRFSGTATVLGV